MFRDGSALGRYEAGALDLQCPHRSRAQKPSFRNAWKRKQFCIIPADNFFEPCYETGKPVRWRIERADDMPAAIAGIWEFRPQDLLLSFSILTINANGHPLMQRFHKPDDEKRMVMILDPDQYHGWLDGSLVSEEDLFQQYPAERLVAVADPLPPRVKKSTRAWTLESEGQVRQLDKILTASCFKAGRISRCQFYKSLARVQMLDLSPGPYEHF